MNKQKTLHTAKPDSLPPGRVANRCHCGTWYSLPACHAKRHRSCTAACAQKARRVVIEARKQSCAECGCGYIPRPVQLAKGHGRFCSNACVLVSARRSPAFLASRPKAVETFRRNYVPKRGPENPRWTGGPEATRKRQLESGVLAERVKQYRKKNPEKVREWSANRGSRKHGRLPRGTVARLRLLQRDKCANCLVSLTAGYHVDHMTPLARGGKHEPENIQLLCPTCNVRKSARDPIQFAQMNGRLL